jgi:hypothetical protein
MPALLPPHQTLAGYSAAIRKDFADPLGLRVAMPHGLPPGPSGQRPLRPGEWRGLQARGNSSPYRNAPSTQSGVLSPNRIITARSDRAKFVRDDRHVKRAGPDQTGLGEPLREDRSAPVPLLRDEDLPMLAAVWLTQGYNSERLRELAGMTRQEARQGGRQLLAGVLSSLGWPMPDWRNAPEEIPWLGYWYQISWARDEIDRLLAPYAAAQRVIEVAGDVPDLWVAAGG